MKIKSHRRTFHAIHLQTAMYARVNYAILPNSTLNEKFNVVPDLRVPEKEYPVPGYWAIGRGGHQATPGSDGIPNITAVPHFASDSALYKHLPFVLRELDNDLAPEERTRYALRVKVTFNGVEYWAYYLKRLVRDDDAIELIKVDSSGVPGPYTPKPEDLSPTPLQLTNGAIPTSGQSLQVLTTVTIDFTAEDVVELQNACSIIYGSTDYAMISEIAICSGADRSVTTGDGIIMNEAICVQLNEILNVAFATNLAVGGFSEKLSIGAAEPLTL